MSKYYMQYVCGGNSSCSIPIASNTSSGAIKKAKSIARQEQIKLYEIIYKAPNGFYMSISRPTTGGR
jgi:hypothetical protein